MISLLAKIKFLDIEKGRKIPFTNGYRPLVKFPNETMRTSGHIELIDTDEFAPKMEGVVKMVFIQGIVSDEYFKVGQNFTFSESGAEFGEGEILEILSFKEGLN